MSGPILAMHATEGMALDWAKDELQETIEANAFISKILQEVGRKNDPYLFKKWPGASLIARGGASGTSYAKISAAAVLMDDADRFKLNIGATTSGKHKDRKEGEGSPIKLLLDRLTGRFGDYKFFCNSSPKSENESLIWPAFLKTDQNHFYVPCPKCGHKMPWEFENLVIPHEKGEYELTGEPYILCGNTDCKHHIHESDKYNILNKAEYRPNQAGIDPVVKGFRINALYSMVGYTFKQYAKDWLSAKKTFDMTGDESEKIRHRNTKQAKPWQKKTGKAVSHSALFKTREKVDPLPENCAILGLGVDLQKAGRIEAQVNGFGELDRYVVDHQIFGGDPTIRYGLEGSPWNALADFITGKRYENIHGKQQPIYCVGIDIGWGKDEAHAKYFIQNFEPLFFQQVFGVFGKEVTKAAISFVSRNPTQDVDGFESWGIYSNIRKVALYNLFERHIKHPEFSNLHFSDRPCFTEQWFKQLTIERKNEKGILEKPHDHARNEALDCMYLADAGFLLAFKDFENGPDYEDFKEWNKQGVADQAERSVNIIGNVF